MPRRPRRPTKQDADDKSAWTDGERHWDRVAAANGVEPMPDDLSTLARLSPDEAQALLEAARQLREAEARGGERRRQSKRGTRVS